jgi:hypothetical protein
LSEYAGFQEKEFDINKMQPYNYALQQSMNLKDASHQNIYGALDQGGAGIITAMQLLNGGVLNGLGSATEKTANKNRGAGGGGKGVPEGTPVESIDVATLTSNPEFQKIAQTLTPDAVQGLIKLLST